jgi:hypothetical protein
VLKNAKPSSKLIYLYFRNNEKGKFYYEPLKCNSNENKKTVDTSLGSKFRYNNITDRKQYLVNFLSVTFFRL